MTITAINGSPKGEKSNSREIITIMQSLLPSETKWEVINQTQYLMSETKVDKKLFLSEILFIAFPLYVDGLPFSLMKFLEKYSQGYLAAREKHPRQRVFAVANCGFHEGVQNKSALDMIKHFCTSSGLEWCGGAGLGTGEMILGIKSFSPESPIRKPIFKTLRSIAQKINMPEGRLDNNLYAQHNFPWILYKIAGESGWRTQAKNNGLKSKDLYARPLDK